MNICVTFILHLFFFLCFRIFIFLGKYPTVSHIKHRCLRETVLETHLTEEKMCCLENTNTPTCMITLLKRFDFFACLLTVCNMLFKGCLKLHIKDYLTLDHVWSRRYLWVFGWTHLLSLGLWSNVESTITVINFSVLHFQAAFLTQTLGCRLFWFQTGHFAGPRCPVPPWRCSPRFPDNALLMYWRNQHFAHIGTQPLQPSLVLLSSLSFRSRLAPLAPTRTPSSGGRWPLSCVLVRKPQQDEVKLNLQWYIIKDSCQHFYMKVGE